MSQYSFRVVISDKAANEAERLDLADRLAEAGCDDGSVGGHAEGSEILFDREAASRDEAMRSAIEQIESAGLSVKRVELDREAISA